MTNVEATQVMPLPGGMGEKTLVVPGTPGATMAMPATGDAYRTQMGGTVTCPVCKSSTPIMDAYCGDCGFLLSSTLSEEPAVPSQQAPAAELVDPQSGRRFRLNLGVNTLGRQGTDILTSDGTVSRNHAKITVDNGVAIIEDLGSSNGTKVGDLRIGANQPTNATHGTPLRFGNWNLLLEINATSAAPTDATIITPAPNVDKTITAEAFSDEATFHNAPLPAPTPSVPKPTLLEPVGGGAVVGYLIKLEGIADDITLTEGVITIGRRPGNTVVITGDGYVSGSHAEIISDATGTYLVDVGSTNGTSVNGQRLTANTRQMLAVKDEVQIGQTRYLFSSELAEEPDTLPLEFDPTRLTDDPSVGNADIRGQV